MRILKVNPVLRIVLRTNKNGMRDLRCATLIFAILLPQFIFFSPLHGLNRGVFINSFVLGLFVCFSQNYLVNAVQKK